jgi:hypothetical protein
MQPTQNTSPFLVKGEAGEDPASEQFDKSFKPKGAIAFFVLLVILGLIVWYGIYFLMLQRM